MRTLIGLILITALPSLGGDLRMAKTTPFKSCPVSTLSAAQTLDRSKTHLEPGFTAVDISDLSKVRSGRITDTWIGSATKDSGNTAPVLIKKTTQSQMALLPQADPLAHEFEMLTAVQNIGEPGSRYFPRPVALGPDFLAIEYYEGGKTLAEVFREHSLTTERAQVIRAHLYEAVQTLNEAGISHGDINPTNILVLADDSIKLVDFGISVRKGDHHVSLGTHGFNSRAQRALGGSAKSDATRAVPNSDNAEGYEEVVRVISLNILNPSTTYVDSPTAPIEPKSGD